MVYLDGKHHSFHQNVFLQDGIAVTPEYDFIIVGGGPSGCALATRLSHMKARVLLIEQGILVEQYPELQNSVSLPLQTRTLHGSSFDAAYPVLSDGQFGTRDVTLNSGTVLGGSSCINWAIWTRGPKVDYDFWAQIVNNKIYGWDSISKIFEKIECRKNSIGPINIRSISESPRKQPGQWSAVAAQAFEEAGYLRTYSSEEYGNTLGYDEMLESICKDGRRATANDYLRTARIRGEMSLKDDKSRDRAADFGLDVWTSVHVQRVVFETRGENTAPVAVAVESNVGIIRARKEIILSAGAVKSTHLLLLSGVGPAGQLRNYGIDLVLEQDHVGQNLWDHPVIDIPVKLKESARHDTAEDLVSVKSASRHLDEWARNRSGLMSGCPYEWIGFSNEKEAIECALTKSTGLNALGGPSSIFDVLLRNSALHIENFQHYGHGLTSAPDPSTASYIAVSAVLLTPASRGSISLRWKPDGSQSVDAHVPNIVLNQLKDPIDSQLMTRAIQKSTDILCSRAWAPYVESPQTHNSPEELSKFMRQRLTTLWHVGGTCSMRTTYSDGVVDDELFVQGVRGLRVADTSVIPFPLAAHTQAVSYAIGEICARFIQVLYNI